jgi:hypothetical protein
VFSYWQDEQPTSVVTIGSEAMLLDFDTGDGGTVYLRAETEAALIAAGFLSRGPDIAMLSGVLIGGAEFGPTPVHVVAAGGAEDFRTSGASDLLRLGAGFLAENPVLWNFPARKLTFLKAGAEVLRQR